MIALQTDEDFLLPFDLSILQAAAAAALPADGDATIVLSNDTHLRELNRQFLGIDAPTDVLSFPSEDSDPETGIRYLGDIVLSVERAAHQAASAGHPLKDELQLLIVHGALHLLGHDHAESAEKERMWAQQNMILDQIGCTAKAP